MSNSQISKELDLNKDDVQKMATQLREGVVSRKPVAILEGIVERDEVYGDFRKKPYQESWQ